MTFFQLSNLSRTIRSVALHNFELFDEVSKQELTDKNGYARSFTPLTTC